jgi:hypothetical protein
VVFKTHHRSASGAKCIGNLVPEKADACMDARAHIHPPSSKSRYAWRLVPVAGLSNTYNIIAHVRRHFLGCAAPPAPPSPGGVSCRCRPTVVPVAGPRRWLPALSGRLTHLCRQRSVALHL